LVEYKTQLAVRRRERPGVRYVPPTLLTIHRELRQAILADIFDHAVLQSIITFFDNIFAYQMKALGLVNASIRTEHLITVDDVALDAELDFETNDGWEPAPQYSWGTISGHQMFVKPDIPLRNRVLQKQIKQKDAEYIHETASDLFKIWPQISDDIEFCKKNALEEFGQKKWAGSVVAV
jgi:hypothetical protein